MVISKLALPALSSASVSCRDLAAISSPISVGGEVVESARMNFHVGVCRMTVC